MSIRTIGRPRGFQFPTGLTTTQGGNSAVEIQTFGGVTRTIDGSNTVFAFTQTGLFKPPYDGTFEYLVVAGGGAGGQGCGAAAGMGGGGGAGGLLYGSGSPFKKDVNYIITVGAGGNLPDNGTYTLGVYGNNGSNSSITMPSGAGSNIVAVGGGGGAGVTGWAARTGGSGGGGAAPTTAAAGTPGQGNAGGAGGPACYQNAGGGGGGAGGAGQPAVPRAPVYAGANGGLGLFYTISGANVGYAGGGGGGNGLSGPSIAPYAGVGGGRGARPNGPEISGSGDVNTGGGGGGGTGGFGGSGIVIIRTTTEHNNYIIN